MSVNVMLPIPEPEVFTRKRELNVDRAAIFHNSHKKFAIKHASKFPPVLRIPPKSLMDKISAGV